MRSYPVFQVIRRWSGLIGLVLLAGCATWPAERADLSSRDAWVAEDTATQRTAEVVHAPVVVHRGDAQEHNRIGTPRARREDDGSARVFIDPARPAYFVERRSFSGERGEYTNFIYRVHFDRVPYSLIPFHLTAGRNVGLFMVVTVDERDRAVLVTTVHTCGCYRAFVPTQALSPQAYPPEWPTTSQRVFGERLPARVGPVGDDERVVITLREGTHRVMGVDVMSMTDLDQRYALIPTPLRPMAALDALDVEGGDAVSMFHDGGLRNDLVRGSFKPLELLLMSWWALDPMIGVDRRLGDADDESARTFYTSLKPWARSRSDMRDFAGFLSYWGWRL